MVLSIFRPYWPAEGEEYSISPYDKWIVEHDQPQAERSLALNWM